jgi:hypothetical protein
MIIWRRLADNVRDGVDSGRRPIDEKGTLALCPGNRASCVRHGQVGSTYEQRRLRLL